MYHVMPVFQDGWSEPIQSTNWVNQAQNQHFSNTYNPGWNNHPNFSWRNDQPSWSPPPQHQYPPYQNPQSYPYVAHPGFQPHVAAQSHQSSSFANNTLEDSMAQMANTLQQFIHANTNNQNTQAINELPSTVNKMSTLEKGKFPAQPPHKETLEETLQAFMQGQAQTIQAITELRSSISDLSSALHAQEKGDVVETAKAVLTLRSGKEVPRPEMTINTEVIAPTPKDAAVTDEAEKEPEVARPEQKEPVSADAETSKGYQPVVPYPQRLAAGKSGVVKLTFGNVALKLNVFNTCKMPASGLNTVESLTPTKFICSNSPFSDNEDDFNFFDCFADSSLPFQGTERTPSEWSTQNKRRFLSELRKQFQKFCKSRWSGPYIVNPREVF
ncbi:hypothetical protein I3842_09G133600 [Carya illinoinensis]|uniref:Uncharacterized protein n=2 Tax=Carya illinoinensis TaxID=32201 RepID=A0A922J7E1_CARIL|nr:hypothetical protein I3842_09G133600 [Carya illinoinensis]